MDLPRADLWELAGFAQNAKQGEAWRAMREAKFTLYGGAAGGGKSYWLRWALLLFLVRAWVRYGMSSVRVGLFCENYPALKDRHLAKIRLEMPEYLGKLRDTKEEGWAFFLRPELGGGYLTFRNLDDPSKYDSVEFAAIGVDELTKNKQAVFDELRKRLRWPQYQRRFDLMADTCPVPEERRGFPADFVFPFVAATNPGGNGHAWVKRFFIDRDLPPELLEVYGLDQFRYVKALAQDNKFNPPSYYRDLLSLPEPLRSAYALGDWDLFQGQFFKEFRRELHVCAPFVVPSYWRRFCAADWGYACPFVNLDFAVSPEGRVYVIGEQLWTQKDTDWLGRELVRVHAGQQIGYRMLDPSCWDASRGVSIAESLQVSGWPCLKAENDRASGWARVREYLAWEDLATGPRAPMLQIFESCTYLIRTLPALIHNVRGDVEDLDTDGEDHGADALRYGLMTRPGVSTIPLSAMSTEYAEAALRAEHNERGKQYQESGWLS